MGAAAGGAWGAGRAVPASPQSVRAVPWVPFAADCSVSREQFSSCVLSCRAALMCLLCFAAASGPDQGPHVLCSTASDQHPHVPAPGPGGLPWDSVTRKAAWRPWGQGGREGRSLPGMGLKG